MNCKQGDLAIVVRGLHNVGKIVRCVKLLGAERVWIGRSFEYVQIWETDTPLEWENGNRVEFMNEAPDPCLKPIPDDLLTQEEKDEIAKSNGHTLLPV